MQVKNLKRDPGRIKQALVFRNGQYIAKEAIRLMFPSYFADRGMADFSADYYVLGMFALLTSDDHYGVLNIPAMVKVARGSISRTTVGKVEYIVLEYEPGALVISTNRVVREDKLVYPIFNDLSFKGKIPWYMSGVNLGYILDGASKYAGTDLGKNRKAIQVIFSLLARNPKNPNQAYRHVVKSFEEVDNEPPYYTALRNVQYLASNTFSKLTGANFRPGVNNALINPTTRVEPIERIFR